MTLLIREVSSALNGSTCVLPRMAIILELFNGLPHCFFPGFLILGTTKEMLSMASNVGKSTVLFGQSI